MSKIKKIISIVIIIILSGAIFTSLGLFLYYKTPTLTIDYSKSEGEISYGAIGWLYGMSEPDIPSGDLILPLKAQIAAVKTADGLQHPMGDVMQVGDYFIDNGGKNLFIYMQDIYAEWYYVYRGQKDYLDKVSLMMDKLLTHDKKDSFIYCPFNENDNGKWYGDFKKQESRQAFYQDWVVIYKKIKEKEPNAYIAGPGYMKYNKKYIKEFLQFCKDNDCMPNMMVWHELDSKSYKNYENNYKTYREIEKQLNINPLRICISEYGRMKDNGIPGQMIQFISMFEKTKVDACIAYWRLANNLSDIVADNNTPSAAWWLYYWYSQMTGNTYLTERKVFKKDGFNGFSTYDKNKDLFTILAGGTDSNSKIILKNIAQNGYKDGDKIYIDIDYVDYVGLSTGVLEPIKLKTYEGIVKDNKIEINLDDISKTRAYKIQIGKTQKSEYHLVNLTKRYEAEDGQINGVSDYRFKKDYVLSKSDLTYASSNKLVSNIWESNNTYSLNIAANEDGLYKLDICYGNGYRKNKTPDSRSLASGFVKINNQENKIILENTISHETTKTVSLNVQLKKGNNLLEIYKGSGEGDSVSIDFIDVTKINESQITINSYSINENKAFVVVDDDGYYTVNTKSLIKLNGLQIENNNIVYLKKGINIFEANAEFSVIKNSRTSEKINNTYDQLNDKYIWSVDVEKTGLYALTFNYANNEEFGNHEYNVQHVERYASILVNNNDCGTYYFRNTFSWENIKTRTIYVQLNAGINEIVAINDSSYIWNDRKAIMPEFKQLTVAPFLINN